MSSMDDLTVRLGTVKLPVIVALLTGTEGRNKEIRRSVGFMALAITEEQ